VQKREIGGLSQQALKLRQTNDDIIGHTDTEIVTTGVEQISKHDKTTN
jgi:hypothetical protein